MKAELNILYITQKVDANDDLLAAIHGWLEDLAGKVHKIYIVCLHKGEVRLPANCQVFSLGKEREVSRYKYLVNFYRTVVPLIFKGKIDGIFIHMNEVYVYLLLPLRILKRIPIVWWKAHGQLNFWSRLAHYFVDRVVTSVSVAYNIPTDKKRVIGQGIDAHKFKPLEFSRALNGIINIIVIGRLSSVRRYDLLLRAVRKSLDDSAGLKLKVTIYGRMPTGSNDHYLKELQNLQEQLGLKEVVTFAGAVPNYQLPEFINQSDFAVNPGGSNSLDKAIVESMACQKIVIDSNLATWEILEKSPLTQQDKELFLFKRGDYSDLAEKIKQVINLNEAKKSSLEKSLRQLVVANHTVNHLNEEIVAVFREVLLK